MAEVPMVTTYVCFGVLTLMAAAIYFLTRKDLPKRHRYRLIRCLMLGVFIGTALLATGTPLALVGLAAQVLDRPDG